MTDNLCILVNGDLVQEKNDGEVFLPTKTDTDTTNVPAETETDTTTTTIAEIEEKIKLQMSDQNWQSHTLHRYTRKSLHDV